MARITWHNENPQLTHALPLETYDTTHGDRYYFHAGRQYAAHFNA